MVKGDGRTGAALGAAAASVGSAASAALAALCCAGPATVALLGVGGAVAAAGLKPYRPLLLLGSLAVLGLGFWLSYRGVSGPGRACPTRLRAGHPGHPVDRGRRMGRVGGTAGVTVGRLLERTPEA